MIVLFILFYKRVKQIKSIDIKKSIHCKRDKSLDSDLTPALTSKNPKSIDLRILSVSNSYFFL